MLEIPGQENGGTGDFTHLGGNVDLTHLLIEYQPLIHPENFLTILSRIMHCSILLLVNYMNFQTIDSIRNNTITWSSLSS